MFEKSDVLFIDIYKFMIKKYDSEEGTASQKTIRNK